MHHVIALMQLVQLFKRNTVALCFARFNFVTVVAFKNLMIGVTANFQVAVDKPFVQRKVDRSEIYVQTFIVENRLQAIGLRHIGRKNIIGEAEVLIINQVFGQHIKIFVKYRLMYSLKSNGFRMAEKVFLPEFSTGKMLNFF